MSDLIDDARAAVEGAARDVDGETRAERASRFLDAEAKVLRVLKVTTAIGFTAGTAELRHLATSLERIRR